MKYLSFFFCAIGFTLTVAHADVKPNVKPIVGAIRWDAWHGDAGSPGKAVQHALSPKEWHSRLPFFAEILDDDNVKIDGTSQEVMDKEIAYARKANLDYWAFVTYNPDDAMSIGLKRYLSSKIRDQINFCLLTEFPCWKDKAFVQRIADLMREPGYQKVEGNRPLLYLGFISEANLKANWGDATTFRKTLDEFRATVKATGLNDPYIVIMDFNPKIGKRWVDEFGAQAISTYATNPGTENVPYAQLAAHAEKFWNGSKGTGAQVVPIVMSGWDRRPRIARPMPWETWQKPGVGIEKFCQAPTPQELAAHLKNALRWIKENEKHATAQIAIIYAWNENDEGGWLVPTLHEGTARIDAIGEVLKQRDN